MTDRQRAKQLREVARENPPQVRDDLDELAELLTSPDDIVQRHATDAARKVAYVSPSVSSRLRKPLVKLVEGQANTSAQRNACIALGYIARVDSQADQALDRLWSNRHSKDVDGAIERGIAIKENLSSLSSSDGESRSGDDELTDPSAVTETGTVGDTKVFDERSSAGGTLNYCPNCGHNLSQQNVRRFCGACGYKLS